MGQMSLKGCLSACLPASLLLSAAPNKPVLVHTGRICFGFKAALFSPGCMGCCVSCSCFELPTLGEIFVHSAKGVSSDHWSAFLAARGDSVRQWRKGRGSCGVIANFLTCHKSVTNSLQKWREELYCPLP